MEADWSNMPIDIIYQIVDKVNSVEDLMAFSVVCHSWYSVYKHAKPRWRPRMPWLMLAENNKDGPNNLRKFFDPITSKCYQMQIPKTFVCWGSAHGWIVAIDLDFEIYMFNPLTRAQAKLPSAYKLPYPLDPEVIDPNDPEDIKAVAQSVCDKIILLKIPRWGDDELLAVSTSGDNTAVGIAKPNGLNWTEILVGNSSSYRRRVTDSTYWNGALFLIDDMGGISYVELDNGVMNKKSLIAVDYSPPPDRVVISINTNRLYLIESSGILLVILRIRSFINDAPERSMAPDPFYKTQAFLAFKVNKETKAWEYVNDAGELSIFVGANATMFMQARENANCRRNCIYFTDDFWEMWKYPKELGGHDMGIYSFGVNLGKKRVSTVLEPLYHGEDSHSRYCCPLWFVPRF